MEKRNATGTGRGGGNEAGDLKLLFIVSYLLLWVSGIVVYLLYGGRNKRLRFHAVQAVLYGIAVTILDIVFGIAGALLFPLGFVLGIVILLLWLYGLYVGYRAMEGEDIRITTIGDMAERYSS